MEQINWAYCQNNSDKILSDGLMQLKESPLCEPNGISYSSFGNYLISHGDKHYYIGEAKDVKLRIKQQFKEKTSTFYKNFQKYAKDNLTIKPIPIENFLVRFIATEIGRKEIEDFGIVNLPTRLNKFQIGKRLKIEIKAYNGLWNQVQNLKEDILLQGEAEVFNQISQKWLSTNPPSVAGIYVVKSNDKIIYIGESSDINERYTTHSSTTYFSALRRHIGTEILKYELKEKNGKKRYFTDSEDNEVTQFLRGTKIAFCAVSFGRYELEEYLIKKYKPLLNRKDNDDN